MVNFDISKNTKKHRFASLLRHFCVTFQTGIGTEKMDILVLFR